MNHRNWLALAAVLLGYFLVASSGAAKYFF